MTYGLHAPPSYHDAVSRSMSATAGMERDLGKFCTACTQATVPDRFLRVEFGVITRMQETTLIESQGFLELALNNMATDLACSQSICVAHSHASVVANVHVKLSLQKGLNRSKLSSELQITASSPISCQLVCWVAIE